MWRPFTADEANLVADALDALYAASAKVVTDTCPIRAACQKHPNLKEADDLAAKITIACGGTYVRATALAWMVWGFYPVAYIEMVVGWAKSLRETR